MNPIQMTDTLRESMIRYLLTTFDVNRDGQNDIGMKVGPGVYFCRFEAGSYSSVKKLVVLK